MYIDPREWKPIGVDDLESKALEVVTSSTDYSVIAGPGAGKTELLAQRACYLLQTGACAHPSRILAISFKRDAARNLGDRVRERSHPEFASRFDSLTFDSFSKGLLDHFRLALPDIWRPTEDYEIHFPKRRDYEQFLLELPSPPANLGTKNDLQQISSTTFERRRITPSLLPINGIVPTNVASWVSKVWWETSLRNQSQKSRLTFPMIGRLATLLLVTNPSIRHALLLTYTHVFMDEFQDTTHVQYDLAKTAFATSGVVVTAVGDNKQHIMRWAMALDNSFVDFERDFSATRVSLIRNYRSSPALVEIQHRIALTIDPNSVRAQSMVKELRPDGQCEILDLSTPQSEARYLAGLISGSITQEELAPHDFAILVKQLPKDYAPVLIPEFNRLKLKTRVEDEVQNLLSEPLAIALTAFLRLGARPRCGKYWPVCLHILEHLRKIDPEDYRRLGELQDALDRFQQLLFEEMSREPASKADAERIVESIVDFLGIDYLRLNHPEYRQGKYLEDSLGSIAELIADRLVAVRHWEDVLDELEGIGITPIMTIHKSKGLEYHTAIFVALDDSAWWNFANQPDDDRAAFFVAFSRAKHRILFTYCQQRGGRVRIASLYEILKAAGVPIRSIRD